MGDGLLAEASKVLRKLFTKAVLPKKPREARTRRDAKLARKRRGAAHTSRPWVPEPVAHLDVPHDDARWLKAAEVKRVRKRALRIINGHSREQGRDPISMASLRRERWVRETRAKLDGVPRRA